MSNPLLDAALDYARRGLSVLALHQPEDGGCSCKEKTNCGTPGKHPRWNKDDLPNGVHSATTDEKIIKAWWKRWPKANVGIATGKISGVLVADIDPRNGGEKGLKKLPGNFPFTTTTRTGGKGEHYYMAYPGNGLEIKNDQDFAGYPGIDIKSDGGFVVAPPSHHISGDYYSWKINLDHPLAPTPNWLLEIIKNEDTPERKSEPVGEVIPKGKRVKTLVSLAGTMRRRGMNEPAILAALIGLNEYQCESPLPDSKIQDIARSCGRYEPGDIAGSPAGPHDAADEEAEYTRAEREAKQAEAHELPPDWRGPLPGAGKDSEGQGEKPSIADLVCDVSTFISIEFPPKATIIEPWLSESTINMLYGPRGIGKTMFALSILCSATTGKPIGPWNVNTPVPSLYLDGEMAQQDTQNRCRRLNSLRNPERQPFIIYSDAHMNQHGLPRANLIDDDWRKMMKALLLANGIKLWVADNIASLAPGIDENSKQEWDPVNQWLLELRFAGITTIFLHHANKDGGQRGTSGREDNIDISILLDWPKGYVTGDGCKFVAKFKKARLEQKHLHLITDTEFALEVDHEEDYFWTFRNLKAENRKTILEMLDQDMAQKDIAEALGIGAGYVSRVRSQAVKDGHLAPNGKLTQSGFVFIYGA